ncbi:DUF4062 domain-containing protein [Microbacter sp. GSS18]|nr:DUF4062 domain-containing protein [Microbacter sp. GSS18]
MGTRAAIRTPDQRIRVFVSSTLRELEPERRAARAAIESLRLAPVMFELGARPHPPRDLYRSYLAQSDVFLGIYGESYGWVAPDEQVSGLEDEYLLSGDLPSLIYIKDPAPQRDERLTGLLGRIQDDDRVSFLQYSTPEQLGEYIRRDLATMLAERFVAVEDRSTLADEAPATPTISASDLPVRYSPIIGRDADLAAVRGMLADPSARLITIQGPGGIGKSRFAIEIAHEEAGAGRDVAFAGLEAVTSPQNVIAALARALGVRDAANQGSLEDKLADAVGGREVLLVVDNMEQVLDAASTLVRLLAEAPSLRLLVTSRSPLRVRAERVYELGALAMPRRDADADEATRTPAVALFAERAAAVRPGFAVTDDNVGAVTAVCRALDGVPLAIELAAARTRSLSTRDLLRRLDSSLSLLVSGPRDLPERQRALRTTIQWSVDLLDDEAHAALLALSVFRGPFSLESAERLLDLLETPDPLGAIEALVDSSLLSRADRGATPRFRMLAVVRAYAAELLSPPDAAAAHAAWIEVYEELATRAEKGLRGEDQIAWLAGLEAEASNLAGVMRAQLDDRRLDEAASHAWLLYLFLWIGGYLGIERDWMAELLDIAERDGVPIEDRTRAIALYHVNAVQFWQDPDYDARPGMTESRDLFARAGDEAGAALAGVSVGLALLARRDPALFPSAIAELEGSLARYRSIDHTWGMAMALVTLGRIALLAGDVATARTRCEESLALARSAGERVGIVIAQNHVGWARFLAGDAEGARVEFAESLDISLALRHEEGIAYGLEAFVALKAAAGDAAGAGRLLGAAQTLRRRKGILNPGAFEFYMIPLGALREAGLGDEIDRAAAAGAELSVTDVLGDVRD